ncbi:MAG TPA: copper chaperone [Deltaproteobacteria bacterium]|nr:copper chaperone [Deltaproteobacteria bacterium]
MKTLSIVAAALVLALVTVQASAAGRPETVTLKVEGMNCGLCAPAVRKALSGVKGVRSAEVSFESKEARVEYDAGETTVDELIRAVAGVGFTASVAGGRGDGGR